MRRIADRVFYGMTSAERMFSVVRPVRDGAVGASAPVSCIRWRDPDHE